MGLILNDEDKMQTPEDTLARAKGQIDHAWIVRQRQCLQDASERRQSRLHREAERFDLAIAWMALAAWIAFLAGWMR